MTGPGLVPGGLPLYGADERLVQTGQVTLAALCDLERPAFSEELATGLLFVAGFLFQIVPGVSPWDREVFYTRYDVWLGPHEEWRLPQWHMFYPCDESVVCTRAYVLPVDLTEGAYGPREHAAQRVLERYRNDDPDPRIATTATLLLLGVLAQ